MILASSQVITPYPNLDPSIMAGSAPETDDVEALAAVLERLDAQPDNVNLIQQQISLMNKLAMVPEVLDATLRLSSLVMLSEGLSGPKALLPLTPDQWLSYIDLLINSSPRPLTLDGFVEILERFEQAEQDYLCESEEFAVSSSQPLQSSSDMSNLSSAAPKTLRGSQLPRSRLLLSTPRWRRSWPTTRCGECFEALFTAAMACCQKVTCSGSPGSTGSMPRGTTSTRSSLTEWPFLILVSQRLVVG